MKIGIKGFRSTIFLTGLSLLFFFSRCHRETLEPMGPQPVPDPVFILLKEKHARLSDYTLDRLWVSYYDGNQKKYLKDFSRATNGFDTLGIMSSREIGSISADLQIKTFYLEYPDGAVDTIFADYAHVSGREAYQHSCICMTPLMELRFNGKVALRDTSRTEVDVYLFPKK